jgi:hypothetical protein
MERLRPKDQQTYEQTQQHRMRVRELLALAVRRLTNRGNDHDASKFNETEWPIFAEFTPMLKDLKYGSPDYHRALEGMKPALGDHYARERHHPEHFPNGVRDMNLFDLIEMLCDWKAAGERHDPPNNIFRSIQQNMDRFKMPLGLVMLLRRTARLLWPVDYRQWEMVRKQQADQVPDFGDGPSVIREHLSYLFGNVGGDLTEDKRKEIARAVEDGRMCVVVEAEALRSLLAYSFSWEETEKQAEAEESLGTVLKEWDKTHAS